MAPPKSPASDNISKRARRGLELVKAQAEKIAANAEESKDVADKAQKKFSKSIDGSNSGAFAQMGTDFMTLVRMVRARASGSYRNISKRTYIAGIAALLYFVNPIDLVPDFLVAAGFLDDAAVFAFTLRFIRRELQRFRNWEEES